MEQFDQVTSGKTEEVKDKLTKALDQAGLSPSVRGEALSLAEFASLADALKGQGTLRCRDKSLKPWLGFYYVE